MRISIQILSHLLGALVLCSAAQAQSEVAASTQQNTAPSRHSVEGYLRFEGMKYQSSIPDKSRLDQSLLVSAQLKAQANSEAGRLGLDLAVGKYVDFDGSQYSVHELYSSAFGNGYRTQFSIGRKIEFWSQLDQDWQLGMWQPKSLFDSLRPEDSGLTGVFFRHQEGDSEILAFASSIFVPTMGPEIKQKNGSLVADSRWYHSPSSTFPLFGKQTRIVYSLDTPELTKLINHSGFGLRFKMGSNSGGLWVSANAGHKPMNSLLLKYKQKLFLPEQDPQTGEVSISPDVGYHQLWGADVGYRFSKSLLAAISYIEDRPESKTPEAPYVIQNPKAMKGFSFHLEDNFELPFLAEAITLTGNYLRILGGEILDYDNAGASQGAIFDQRFNFTNAASLRTDMSTYVFGRRLMSSLKYMREFDQHGSLLNGEFNFYPQKSLALIVGADILGVDNGQDSDVDTRFLNQFRANDRVYGGLSYVF